MVSSILSEQKPAMLSESHRSRLADIVGRMESDGVATESIQEYVNAYKRKYTQNPNAKPVAPQDGGLGGGLETLPAGLSDRQAAFETAKLNAGAKAGTYFKDEAAKRKAKTLNADQTAKVLNDAAASVAGAFTDNPVMDALAKGKKLMAQTLGQGPANLAFGPGEKGLPGHVAGAVGGVASAPFDIGADVVNFASKGEWQAGVNILLKSGALIVPAGKLAGAGLKALSKTKAGIEFNAARGMKALIDSGIDEAKARQIVAKVQSDIQAPPVVKEVPQPKGLSQTVGARREAPAVEVPAAVEVQPAAKQPYVKTKMGGTVDGLEVGTKVANKSSAQGHFDHQRILPGVHEIQLTDDIIEGYHRPDRVGPLADQIALSGKIDPLIVGVGLDGKIEIIEGQHRLQALRKMGKKSFPAMVVQETPPEYVVSKSGDLYWVHPEGRSNYEHVVSTHATADEAWSKADQLNSPTPEPTPPVVKEVPQPKGLSQTVGTRREVPAVELPTAVDPRTEGAVKQPWEMKRRAYEVGRGLDIDRVISMQDAFAKAKDAGEPIPETASARLGDLIVDPDMRAALHDALDTPVNVVFDEFFKPNQSGGYVTGSKVIRIPQRVFKWNNVEELRTILAHEGTHALRDLKGRKMGMLDVPYAERSLEKSASKNSERLNFVQSRNHDAFVEQALKEGKPVPAEVLADYPDLAAKYKPEPTPLKTVVLTDPKTGKQQPAHPHEFSDSDLLEILDRKRQSAQTMASQQSFNANGKTLMQDVKALQAEAERRGLRGAGESGKTGGVKTEVMYHGGPAGLTELTLGGKRGHDAGGIFFTPSKEYAEQYSTGGLYEADVPIADIFDSRNPEHLKQLENGFRKMAEDGEYDSVDDALRDYHTIVKMDLRDWATGSQYVDAMEAAGFKGARFQERPGTIGLDGGTFTVSGDPIDSVALFQGPVKVRPHSPTAKPIAGGSSDTGTAPKVPETGAQPPLGSTVEGTFGTSNQAFEASQNIEAPVGKGQSEPSNPSALRQEDTKAFREQEGMDGYEKTTVTDAELMKLARDHNPHAVAAKVLKGEAITADEHTALGVEIQRVRRLMREAKNAGDGDAWIKHYKDAEIFALARDTSASGAARTVRSQRLIMDDAYDHFGLTQRIKEAGGESAVTKHTAETDRMVSDIEAKNAALEKELADARSQIEALLKTKGVPARKAYTPQERRVSALTRLRSLGVPTAEVGEVIGGGMPRGKAGSHTGAIPIPKGMEAKIATELRKLIRSYAGEVNNFNDVMAKLKSDLPGIDEENVHFLLNGKWKEAKLEADIAKRAADKLVRDVKADSVYQAKSLMGKMWHHSFGLLNTTARGLQTTLDDSMALIQGKNVLLWKPGTWVTSVAKGLKAGFTKNPIAAAERSVAKLQNHPLYARAVEAGVEFSDVHGSFNKQEEFFAGRIEEKVPGLSHSKALATVTMNEMRMDLFRKLSRMAPNDPAYLKDIAQQINIATGKGTGKVAKFLGGEIAGNVSYAPRYYLSKWQDNLMVPLFAAKTKGGKIQAGQMYATRAIALGTLIPVAEMFGVKVETDVRSANFGRATLPNGYSFDLFNKMSEGVRTTARLFYGSVSRNGNYKAPDAYGSYSIGDYLESKGSPIVRTFNMVRTGTVYDDETGDRRPAEAKDFWSQYLPLSAKEMVPIGKDINGPDDPKLFLFPLSFLGGDVRGKGPSKEIKTPAPPLKAMPPGLEKMLRGG